MAKPRYSQAFDRSEMTGEIVRLLREMYCPSNSVFLGSVISSNTSATALVIVLGLRLRPGLLDRAPARALSSTVGTNKYLFRARNDRRQKMLVDDWLMGITARLPAHRVPASFVPIFVPTRGDMAICPDTGMVRLVATNRRRKTH